MFGQRVQPVRLSGDQAGNGLDQPYQHKKNWRSCSEGAETALTKAWRAHCFGNGVRLRLGRLVRFTCFIRQFTRFVRKGRGRRFLCVLRIWGSDCGCVGVLNIRRVRGIPCVRGVRLLPAFFIHAVRDVIAGRIIRPGGMCRNFRSGVGIVAARVGCRREGRRTGIGVRAGRSVGHGCLVMRSVSNAGCPCRAGGKMHETLCRPWKGASSPLEDLPEPHRCRMSGAINLSTIRSASERRYGAALLYRGPFCGRGSVGHCAFSFPPHG